MTDGTFRGTVASVFERSLLPRDPTDFKQNWRSERKKKGHSMKREWQKYSSTLSSAIMSDRIPKSDYSYLSTCARSGGNVHSAIKVSDEKGAARIRKA